MDDSNKDRILAIQNKVFENNKIGRLIQNNQFENQIQTRIAETLVQQELEESKVDNGSLKYDQIMKHQHIIRCQCETRKVRCFKCRFQGQQVQIIDMKTAIDIAEEYHSPRSKPDDEG
jgi:hypothetical protein